MAPTKSRRRSRSVYEEQRAEQSSDSESSKRQRLDGNDKDDADSEDDDPFATPYPSQARPAYNAAINGRPTPSGRPNGHAAVDNTFQPGAIVRVMVENFVTYEHAEFLPGPKLNMVIGPNGTGKSSLVCAICLGLGFKPQHLGRTNKVGEYVKHGKDAAIIEVELQKRPKDRANHVIRVQITKEDDRRKWWINGRESPHKAVEALTRSLRIQIDNLCQFLPQDKVAEFAALSPVQLLNETLRAAAPLEMSDWHSQLKDYHTDHKKVKEVFNSCAETLRGHETRQQGLQADVDRLNERDVIKKKIEDWQNARVCAEYNTAREMHGEANRKRKKAEERLKILRNSSGPALDAVNRKQDYQAKIEAVVERRKQDLKATETAADTSVRAIDAQEDKRQHLQNMITAEKASFQTRREAITNIRRKLTEYEGKLNAAPPAFVAADWNTKIREQEHILRESQAERRQFDSQNDDIRQQGSKLMRESKSMKQEMEKLDSQEGQQLSFLRQVSPDAAKGWEWLVDHQGEFEKEIFGPPMLTCSLKDDRYSSLIQSLLQNDDFHCFTAQTRNDHKKISDVFYGQLGLLVTIRTCANDYQSFKPPTSVEEAKRLGLDGFAINYLEGPDPVLAMLCSEKRLHASGVALQEISNEQYEQLVNGQKISQWATGETIYRVIRRREYGPDATTTSTRKVRPGRYWTDQPVDDVEKVNLQRQLAEKTALIDDLKKQLAENKARIAEIDDRDQEVNRKLKELRSEKSELQTARTQWEALPDKITSEKNNLKAKFGDLNECKARVRELQAQEDEALVEKAECVLRHKTAVSHIREAHQALLDVQIRLIEAASDVRSLKERNVELIQQLEEKEEEIKRYAAEAAEAKREAIKARDKVERVAASPNAHEIVYYNGMVEGKSVEDIDHEIGAEHAKLELIHVADPGVIRQFEKRAQDIEQLTKQKDEMARKLEHIADQMGELMGKWEPELDKVIHRINEAFAHNFEQISCAGEVSVHKDEDFDQWAIEIKVKFREHETLQQLNQHRQSGGERAVSTIFYLMALQSMAQAPFRVVDEINQGMDPRNERMVHERMVEIACREHTSQYFLITPKLLTGLRYVEGMRVLCIASGEHVPSEGRKLDFSKLVGIQRALKAAG